MNLKPFRRSPASKDVSDSAKKAFKRVHATLKNTKYGTLIKALIKLAEKEVNPAMLSKLIAKFTEVRDSLAEGIVNTEDEEAS